MMGLRGYGTIITIERGPRVYGMVRDRKCGLIRWRRYNREVPHGVTFVDLWQGRIEQAHLMRQHYLRSAFWHTASESLL